MITNAYYEKMADDNNYFYFTLTKNNKCFAHFHKNIEIVFVKSGRHRISINGVERVLSAGEIAFSGGYDVHYYNYEGESEVYIMLLGSDYYNRFDKEYQKKFESFLPVKGDATKRIFDLLGEFYAEKDRLNNIMLFGYLNLILGIMASVFPFVSKSQKKDNVVVEILTYINENYKENITLEQIAKRFGYSKTYFSMLFNKYINMSFCDYLNRIRIAGVKDLLDNKENDSNTITAIAFSNGFGSVNSFYRAKKKFYKK